MGNPLSETDSSAPGRGHAEGAGALPRHPPLIQTGNAYLLGVAPVTGVHSQKFQKYCGVIGIAVTPVTLDLSHAVMPGNWKMGIVQYSSPMAFSASTSSSSALAPSFSLLGAFCVRPVLLRIHANSAASYDVCFVSRSADHVVLEALIRLIPA